VIDNILELYDAYNGITSGIFVRNTSRIY